jgi:hypothetical protein
MRKRERSYDNFAHERGTSRVENRAQRALTRLSPRRLFRSNMHCHESQPPHHSVRSPAAGAPDRHDVAAVGERSDAGVQPAVARKILRLPDGRGPQAGQLGPVALVLPDPGEELGPHEAGRAREDERGPALHRALHLLAGEPGQARTVLADCRETGRSTRAERGRGEEARCRRPRGHRPELRAALVRSRSLTDGSRVRLRVADAHGRRSDAHAGECHQHRAPVDQP